MITSALALSIALIGAQSQADPMKPAPETKLLQMLVGTWTGEAIFTTMGPATKAPATMVGAMSLGGRYYEAKNNYNFPGLGPIEGKLMMSFDAKSASFKAWWYDQMSPLPIEFTGTGSEGVIKATSDLVEMGGMPEKVKMRMEYRKVNADTLKFTLEMQTKDTWTKAIEVSYKRRASNRLGATAMPATVDEATPVNRNRREENSGRTSAP